MARPRIVTVDLDGVSYPLRWDFNTLAIIEELTGQNVMGGELVIDARGVVSVLYAGMDAAARATGKGASPLSRDEIGALLDPTDAEQMTAVVQAVYRLAGLNSPEQKEAPPDADPQPAPTEETSSPSRAATSSPAAISVSASASSGS